MHTIAIFLITSITDVKAEEILTYPFDANHDNKISVDFDEHGSYCNGCQGVDYDSTYETVYATISGTVTVVEGKPDGADADDSDLYGNYVRITSGSWSVIHAHLASEVWVNNGSYVEAGTPLGLSSNSGFTSGSDVDDSFYHLHLEVEYNAVDVDPYTFDGGLFIIDSDGSYRYPSELETCTTTATYPVILTQLEAGTTYELLWWLRRLL